MRKTTTDHVLRVQHQLTERDWRLLGWLYDHSVLTSFQIAHALFPSLNYAQRRLTQLTELGLLERFRPFRLQGGSYPYHYALAHTGALVVAATRGDEPPRRAASTTRLHRIATSRNLDHRLGINQFFTDLAAHERLYPAARLHHWWPDTRLNRFFSPPGTMAYGRVNADALGVWSEDGQTTIWYLEHDQGTEGSVSWWRNWPATATSSAAAARPGRCCSGCTRPPARPTSTAASPTTGSPCRSRRLPATASTAAVPPRRSGICTALRHRCCAWPSCPCPAKSIRPTSTPPDHEKRHELRCQESSGSRRAAGSDNAWPLQGRGAKVCPLHISTPLHRDRRVSRPSPPAGRRGPSRPRTPARSLHAATSWPLTNPSRSTVGLTPVLDGAGISLINTGRQPVNQPGPGQATVPAATQRDRDRPGDGERDRPQQHYQPE